MEWVDHPVGKMEWVDHLVVQTEWDQATGKAITIGEMEIMGMVVTDMGAITTALHLQQQRMAGNQKHAPRRMGYTYIPMVYFYLVLLYSFSM